MTGVTVLSRLLVLGLGVALTACGGGPIASDTGASVPVTADTTSAGEPDGAVTEGLNGEAFLEWVKQRGLRCSGPESFLPPVQQWTCTDRTSGPAPVEYTVMILAQDLKTVSSVSAMVEQTEGVDPDAAADFLAAVAENISFTGADPTAAGAWVRASVASRMETFDSAGVNYRVAGPPERKILEVVWPAQ